MKTHARHTLPGIIVVRDDDQESEMAMGYLKQNATDNRALREPEPGERLATKASKGAGDATSNRSRSTDADHI